MNEKFDPREVEAVAAAMFAFYQRCEEIMLLLNEKRSLRPIERQEIQRLYASLKHDLDVARKHGTLSGRREPRTRAEDCFYDPAVRAAHIDLRAATNSNPISSRWFSLVQEAQSEFSYWLHNLGRPPRP
jgi:hypothetical protein